MTLIKNEDTPPMAPVIPDSKALTCTLEKSSSYRKAKDVVRVGRGLYFSTTFFSTNLDISFQRTIRVPDGKGTSELPPSMGTFPLYSVANYAERLPKAMAAKGGLFFPMYQREAMWISLEASLPFAVQIFVGGVNAVSGEPIGDNEATLMRRLSLMEEKKSIQDYVVTPEQLWLDGIATGKGRVRQFVAMPLGSGYSVEFQATGQDLVGGIQFRITPSTPQPLSQKWVPKKAPNPPGFDDSPIQIHIRTLDGKQITLTALPSDLICEVMMQVRDKEGIPVQEQRFIFGGNRREDGRSLAYYNIETDSTIHLAKRLYGGGGGPDPKDMALGVAPGGLIKQCILEDTNSAMIWERDRSVCFNVQILNSALFEQVTGKAPPSTPISAKTYADQGLPFYKIYGETSAIKGDFDAIKSVKEIDKIKNKNGKRENEGDDALEPNKKPKDSNEDKELDTGEDGTLVDADGDEQPFQNPIIQLYSDDSADGKLTPMSELMEELSRMKLRKSKLRPAKK